MKAVSRFRAAFCLPGMLLFMWWGFFFRPMLLGAGPSSYLWRTSVMLTKYEVKVAYRMAVYGRLGVERAEQ